MTMPPIPQEQLDSLALAIVARRTLGRRGASLSDGEAAECRRLTAYLADAVPDLLSDLAFYEARSEGHAAALDDIRAVLHRAGAL
jgi:hypothetical protein